MDQAKKEQISKDLEKLPEIEQNDIISVEESYIQELTEKYINSLDDPQEIKTDIGLFKNMLAYIYNNYLCDYLIQYKKYSIPVLDNIFCNIYIPLVNKYKKNKLCNIQEFCLYLVNVNCNEISDIKNGNIKSVSIKDIELVQKWAYLCESALVDDNGVKSIFLLKSKYGYVEQTAAQPIIHAQNVLNVGSLPDIKDIMLTDGKATIIDNGNKR